MSCVSRAGTPKSFRRVAVVCLTWCSLIGRRLFVRQILRNARPKSSGSIGLPPPVVNTRSCSLPRWSFSSWRERCWSSARAGTEQSGRSRRLAFVFRGPTCSDPDVEVWILRRQHPSDDPVALDKLNGNRHDIEKVVEALRPQLRFIPQCRRPNSVTTPRPILLGRQSLAVELNCRSYAPNIIARAEDLCDGFLVCAAALLTTRDR